MSSGRVGPGGKAMMAVGMPCPLSVAFSSVAVKWTVSPSAAVARSRCVFNRTRHFSARAGFKVRYDQLSVYGNVFLPVISTRTEFGPGLRNFSGSGDRKAHVLT